MAASVAALVANPRLHNPRSFHGRTTPQRQLWLRSWPWWLQPLWRLSSGSTSSCSLWLDSRIQPPERNGPSLVDAVPRSQHLTQPGILRWLGCIASGYAQLRPNPVCCYAGRLEQPGPPRCPSPRQCPGKRPPDRRMVPGHWGFLPYGFQSW